MLYFRGHAHSGVQAYATWIRNEMEPKYVFPPPHLPQKRVEIQSIPLRELGTGPKNATETRHGCGIPFPVSVFEGNKPMCTVLCQRNDFVSGDPCTKKLASYPIAVVMRPQRPCRIT